MSLFFLFMASLLSFADMNPVLPTLPMNYTFCASKDSEDYGNEWTFKITMPDPNAPLTVEMLNKKIPEDNKTVKGGFYPSDYALSIASTYPILLREVISNANSFSILKTFVDPYDPAQYDVLFYVKGQNVYQVDLSSYLVMAQYYDSDSCGTNDDASSCEEATNLLNQHTTSTSFCEKK